jgi:4'-phosphopantetheinyl transferase
MAIDVWFARDAQLRDPETLRRFEAMLAPEERARAAGMHFPEDRHQQLVARGMMRTLLSRYVPGVAPAEWRFERNEHGKPRIALGAPPAAQGLAFNLAHTTGLVVLAVARNREIGVDVEYSAKRAPLKVAQRHFSAQEVAALNALPPGQQALRFQRLWTLKESYLKAIGTGVVGGLGTMTFHFETDGVRFERAADPEAASWNFREIAVPDGYLVALAWLDRAGAAPGAVTLREFTGSGQEERAEP